jgi:hypothetical protein
MQIFFHPKCVALYMSDFKQFVKHKKWDWGSHFFTT